jgi:phage replication initiation protein
MQKDLTLVNPQSYSWLDELEEFKDAYGITQQQLADTTGYSREYINALIKGRKQLTAQAKTKLTTAMRVLTKRNNLDFCIDYFRVTFKSHDAQSIIQKIFQIRPEHFYREDWAFYGYTHKLVCGELTVMLSQQPERRHGESEEAWLKRDKGTMIELSGQGCRYLENYLSGQKRSWYDVFIACQELHGRFKRIDLAINDRHGVLDIPELIEKYRNDEYRSRFKGGKIHRSDRDHKEGNTLELGSRQSGVHMVIYEKDFEQWQKQNVLLEDKLPIEEQPIKNRFEVRLTDERADSGIEALLSTRDPEKVIFGIINHYICFLTPTKSKSKQSWPIDPRWATFIGANRDKLSLTVDPQPFDFTTTVGWLKKQVSSSLKLIVILDEMLGTHTLDEIIDAGKLSPRQIDLIQHYQNGNCGAYLDDFEAKEKQSNE